MRIWRDYKLKCNNNKRREISFRRIMIKIKNYKDNCFSSYLKKNIFRKKTYNTIITMNLKHKEWRKFQILFIEIKLDKKYKDKWGFN
jgi:hypothetical protein